MGNSKEKQNKFNLMNNTFIKRAGLVIALIQTASALSLNKAGCLGMHQSTTSDDDNGNHFSGPGMAGDPCLGFDETTGKYFGACAKGLMCRQTAEVSIPGAGKTCVFPPALVGEACEGFNEFTGMAFPDCAKGLKCMDTHEVSIPGAGKTCAVPAQVGEPCEGHDENTGMPFPGCAAGLTCMEIDELTIP